jgi:hypothetical protein
MYLNNWMFRKPYCDNTLTNVGTVVIRSSHPKTLQSIGSLLSRRSFDMGEYQSVGLDIWTVVKRYVIDWETLSHHFKPRSVQYSQKWPFIPWSSTQSRNYFTQNNIFA